MKRTSRKSLIFGAIALIATALAPMAVWSGGGLQVAAVVPVGDAVVVKVANTSPNTVSGLLTLTAVVDGVPSIGATTLTVEGGGAAQAVVNFGGRVDFVLTTKIMDEPSPY
jgi:hypothetical protein